MNRNMLRRVELAWPVTDPALRHRVVEECLTACMNDTRDAWLLQPDGSYVRAADLAGRKARRSEGLSAQATLMTRYGSKG
jgi:polyphosphate kinase